MAVISQTTFSSVFLRMTEVFNFEHSIGLDNGLVSTIGGVGVGVNVNS